MILLPYLSGANTAGFLLAALFFLRFWRRSGDSLFLWFAGAFLLLGLEQLTLIVAGLPPEQRGWIYLFRLAAFAGIVGGIVRKNRSPASGG